MKARRPISSGGLGGGIREVVHVIVAGDAEADQLQAAQLDSPANILLGDFGFQGPDLLLQPGHQLHVVGIAAQKCHGQVSVAVDEPGDGQFSPPVD